MHLYWIFIEVDAELVGSNMVSGRNGICQTNRGYWIFSNCMREIDAL